MTRSQIEKRIGRIQQELGELGPLHPGSISEQYNVCGTPGCRCKDPERPEKHGPYYQLSYTWSGRHTTRFVRPEERAGLQARLDNHRRLRELVQEWVALSVEALRLERAAR
jgi:hypothetical protein